MPRLTVVLPVYNHECYIEEALQSIFAQDYGDFEIVAADDASTDGSLEILERHNKTVRILRNPHSGPGAARNRALETTDSEFVAFMDADDVCLPWRFSIQMQTFANERVDLVASELSFIDASGKALPGAWRCPPYANRDYWGALLERNWIGTPSVMIRRSVFQDSGLFDETFTHAEDYDLWLRIGRSFRIGYVDAPLVQCRRHNSNTSIDIDSHQSFERRALRKVETREAFYAFDRLHSSAQARDEAWIWFLLRSGNAAFDAEVHRALRDHPDSSPIQFALGVFLYDHGRFDEARSVFAPLRTGDAASMNNYAVASAADGDLPAAVTNLEGALRLRPDYHDARQNIAALMYRRNLRLTRRPFRESLVPMV